jgi:hypothetical protein
MLGIGKGGLNGPLKEGGDALGIGAAAERLGDNWFGRPQTMGAPATALTGAYGPPTAEQATAPVQIQANGDRNVTVNIGGTSATPQAVAGAVSGALDADRNALIASRVQY